MFVLFFDIWYNYTKQNFYIMTKEQASQISKNFKRIRKEKNLSKSVLVMKTGLDYHTISKIENGTTPDPRINTVVRLIGALEISFEDLIK